MYLNLPPKTEQTLIAQATAQGMSVEDWAIAILTANAKPSYAKGDFDFDLQRMKQAVEAPSISVPKFDTPEQLLAWMDGLIEADFVAE